MSAEQEVRISHLIDDYERLRTDQLRAARTGARMLRDALEALADGRLHITQEFVERTAECLELDVDRLEGLRYGGCGTSGCKAGATHRLTVKHPNGDTVLDRCERDAKRMAKDAERSQGVTAVTLEALA